MEQLCPPTEVEDKLEKLVDHMLSEHQTSDKQNSSLKESTAATSGEANKNSDIDFHNDAFEMQNLVSSVFSKRIEACVDSTLTNMKNVVIFLIFWEKNGFALPSICIITALY